MKEISIKKKESKKKKERKKGKRWNEYERKNKEINFKKGNLRKILKQI